MKHSAHKSLELLLAKEELWWTLLPIREDISLALAMDKKFWKTNGWKFGWQSDTTPFESALQEIETVDLTDAEKFYKNTSLFEPGISRSKVGSWCWWISIKNLNSAY